MPTAETTLEKWPIVIICERGQTKLLGYLSSIKDDGHAHYQSLGAKRTIIISPDGKIQKTGGNI